MKFPPGYSIDKYKKVNKLKIGQAYRVYYRAMHKAHLKDCKETGERCIKSRSQFVGHHWSQHNKAAESAKREADTNSLYGKCLKNKKRSSKVRWNEGSKSYELVATPNSPYSNQIKAYMQKIGCDKLSADLKTKIDNEIIQEAKTAKRVKQGKFARWSRSLKKNKGAAVTNYQKSDKYKQYKAAQAQAQATIPWERRTPAGKLMACQKAKARYEEQKALYITPDVQQNAQKAEEIKKAQKQLRSLYNQRGCSAIINDAKTAAAKPAPKPTTSLF